MRQNRPIRPSVRLILVGVFLTGVNICACAGSDSQYHEFTKKGELISIDMPESEVKRILGDPAQVLTIGLIPEKCKLAGAITGLLYEFEHSSRLGRLLSRIANTPPPARSRLVVCLNKDRRVVMVDSGMIMF